MGRIQQTSDEEILRAARQCFEELGANVSTSEIARRLNISQATLFSRFGTKKTLMIAAMAPKNECDWLEGLRQGPVVGRDLREQFIAHAWAFYRHFKDIVPNLDILRAAGVKSEEMFTSHGEPSLPQMAFDELCGWIVRAQAKGLLIEVPAPSLALALIGAVHARSWLSGYFPVEKGLPHEDEYLPAWVDAVWRGLAPKASA